jgi:transcriptional regulator GlxA family with amidase domain
LLDAFRRHFDVTPQAFLMNYRLHQARDYLLSSDPEQTAIAAIASRNGSFDFGRFAAKYRQIFGENPSVTLRRPHSRPSAAPKAASE